MTINMQRWLLSAAVALGRPWRQHRWHLGANGAVVAGEADPPDRPADRRQRDRRHGAYRDGSGLRPAGPADHRGKPSRRRQHHRHGRGRQGGPRRLHPARQFLDPYGDAGDPVEFGIRDDRPCRHCSARQHARGDGVQSLEGLQEARRFRSCREGEARLGELRLGGCGEFVPSQRRAVPAGGRLRGGASAVQGRAGGADRGDRGTRRLLFRAAGERAAAAQGRPAASACRERLVARLRVARRADHGRSRLSQLGVQLLGRRVRAGEELPPTSAPSSMPKSRRRCKIRLSATSSQASAPIRCRSVRSNSRRWCAGRSRPTPSW